MARKTCLMLIGFSLLMSAPGARAAPASQEEADRLRSVLERYVGTPAPGDAPAITVTPQGSDYRASFDLKALARALEGFGVSVEPATSAVVLTPNDNGTWHVAMDAFPPLVIHFKDQTLKMQSSTYRFGGTFDPKISAFSEASATQDGATFDQDAPAMSQQRRIGHAASTQKAAATEGGTASIEGHYTISDVSDHVVIRAPAPKGTAQPAPAPAPPEISYTLANGAFDVGLDRLHVANLLDLWAFFVAHPNHDSLVAAQEDLRTLLKAALPFFAGLREGGSASDLSLTTNAGVFSARKLAGSLEFADLAAAGKASLGFNMDGLTIPETTVPAWAAGLVPTAFDIKPSLIGFHLDEALSEAVQEFDLKQNGLSPAQMDKIGQIVWPAAGGRVVLGPSRITSALLDLKLDGEATLGAMPSGHLTVVGTGLDAAIAALQSAGATDPSAAQLLAQFVLAKNLSKPNPDGSVTWLVEASGTGPVTVNGTPLQ